MSKFVIYNAPERSKSPVGPNNPPSGLTGIICFIRCCKCKRETIEFSNIRNLQRYAMSNNWRKIGNDYICSYCFADNILYNQE